MSQQYYFSFFFFFLKGFAILDVLIPLKNVLTQITAPTFMSTEVLQDFGGYLVILTFTGQIL